MKPIIRIAQDAWQTKGVCQLTQKKCMVHEITISGVKIFVNNDFYKQFQKIKRIVAHEKAKNA